MQQAIFMSQASDTSKRLAYLPPCYDVSGSMSLVLAMVLAMALLWLTLMRSLRAGVQLGPQPAIQGHVLLKCVAKAT